MSIVLHKWHSQLRSLFICHLESTRYSISSIIVHRLMSGKMMSEPKSQLQACITLVGWRAPSCVNTATLSSSLSHVPRQHFLSPVCLLATYNKVLKFSCMFALEGAAKGTKATVHGPLLTSWGRCVRGRHAITPCKSMNCEADIFEVQKQNNVVMEKNVTKK